jgi:hypothetical protein
MAEKRRVASEFESLLKHSYVRNPQTVVGNTYVKHTVASLLFNM